MLPFTQKELMAWGGPHEFELAKKICDKGSVRQVDFEPPFIKGTVVRGEREIKTQLKLLSDGSVENGCPCRDSVERGVICAHVLSLGIELIRRNTDPDRARKAKEEMRRAARLESIDESAYIQRVPSDTHDAVRAQLRVYLGDGWEKAYRNGQVPLVCTATYADDEELLDRVPRDLPLSFTAKDESILFVLEDICEGPAKGALSVTVPDFINILEVHAGKSIYVEGQSEEIEVNAARMTSVLRLDLDRENGEMIMMVHTELPFMDSKSFPLYIVSGNAGWVYDAKHFWPLENLLPGPLQTIYEKPVVVERPAIPRFLETEIALLEAHMRVETDVSKELFQLEPEQPKFRLEVRGSPASLAATLYTDYRDVSLIAGKADAEGLFAHPDPDDLLRYTVRHGDAETKALARLAEVGFVGERGDDLTDIVGTNAVLNFLGSGLPKIRRRGWKVDLVGKVEPYMEKMEFATPVVRVNQPSSGGWFEVDFDYEDGEGGSLAQSDIQRALLKGDSYIDRGGRTILLDADAITGAREVFTDCASGEGSGAGKFRMDGIYTAYVKSALDALDGIDVEAAPEWQGIAQRQNRNAAVEPLNWTQHLIRR